MNNDKMTLWMEKIDKDNRINIWHKGILMAMVQICKEVNWTNPFQITRKRIMEIARIKGIPTYHKYIKELQGLNYIDYYPSFHPMLGSQVFLKP